ncbi:MAG: hypothetical protein RR784_07695, partial [Burkholderiaceae bacterium]
MESQSSSWAVEPASVRPFWKRIPKFFRFPAYLPPALRNLGLSAVLAVAIHSEAPLVVALV